jgi:serine/threonine protein kinase
VARKLLPELDGINSVGGLRKIEEALKREEDLEYRELASAVRFRRQCLELKFRSSSSDIGLDRMEAVNLSKALNLNYEDFPKDFFKAQPPHQNTVIDGKDVLIEWKHYARKAPLSMTQRAYDTEVNENIRHLAHVLAEDLKPWRLRALDCVGYHERQEEGQFIRVCFAFNLPKASSSELISLQTLMEEAQTYEKGRFFLGDQFTLAQGLASAVYQLHFSGLLHKGIRSSNIHFFKPASAPETWRADPNDFFLMGYELSRMIATPSVSAKPGDTPDSARYVHPKYWDSVETGFRPYYDIYSLGVVLIEIALWKTAKRMARELNTNPERTEISLKQWQTVVPKILIPLVEQRAGRVYGDVVRMCIEGNFGDNLIGSNFAGLLKALDKEVVAKLEKCYA